MMTFEKKNWFRESRSARVCHAANKSVRIVFRSDELGIFVGIRRVSAGNVRP